MKFLIIFTLSFCTLTKADLKCELFFGDMTCFDGEIKQGEPIKVEVSHTNLFLKNVSGTIDAKTLSLLPHMVELTIIKSDITQIENGALCSAPKLKRLYIADNTVFPTLTKDLLSNCGNIEIISTSNVKLELDAFKNMPNLEEIRMHKQKLNHFTKDYLEGLNNLREFGFLESAVDKVDSGVFCFSPKMQKLTFKRNSVFPKITHDLLKGCSNLKELFIQNDENQKVVKIDDDTLNELSQLVVLDIINVDIDNIGPKNFAGLTALERIFLQDTNTESIDENAFKDLKNLQKLFVNGGKLTDVKPNTFKGLTSLTELNLAGNKLTGVENIKDLPKLTTLNLAANSISTIDVDTFTINLPSLEVLIIYNNPMSCDYKNELAKKLKAAKNIESMTSLDPGYFRQPC